MQFHPVDTVVDLHARYGPIAEFGVRPFRYTIVFGEQANRLVLSDRADAFTWAEAFAMLAPVDGENALVMSEGEVHRRRRRMMQTELNIKRINTYLDVI